MRGRAVGHEPRLEQSDDLHLSLLLVVLKGVAVEQRAAWLQRRMPRTAAMLGLRAHWEQLADLDAPPVTRSAARGGSSTSC